MDSTNTTTMDNTSVMDFALPKVDVREESVPDDIFREVCNFKAGSNYVGLQATDKPSIIPSNDDAGEKINSLLSSHKKFWPELKKEVVSLVIKNGSSGDLKYFNFDFKGFIVLFKNTDNLIKNVNDMADELVRKWNDRNSSKSKRYVRTESTKVLPLDVRDITMRGTKKKKYIELVFAGTTYNFTLDVQTLDTNVIALREHCWLQLRLQHSDTNSIKGQLTMSIDDWIAFFTHPKLHEFCLILQKHIESTGNGITKEYIENIERYYNTDKIHTKPMKKRSDNLDYFRKRPMIVSSDSSEVSDADDPPQQGRKTGNGSDTDDPPQTQRKKVKFAERQPIGLAKPIGAVHRTTK